MERVWSLGLCSGLYATCTGVLILLKLIKQARELYNVIVYNNLSALSLYGFIQACYKHMHTHVGHHMVTPLHNTCHTQWIAAVQWIHCMGHCSQNWWYQYATCAVNTCGITRYCSCCTVQAAETHVATYAGHHMMTPLHNASYTQSISSGHWILPSNLYAWYMV